jgi:uncharacterized protein YndB with AHSA1/START domain
MSTHGTYDTSGDRPTLRFERRIAHPIEAVWRTISEPAELAHWFPTEVRGEVARAGATLEFVFPGEDRPHLGQVLEAEPPRLLVFTWFDDVLRFELEEDGEGATTLRFSHAIEEVAGAARTAAGWTVCLDGLEQAAKGTPTHAPGSEPTPEWRAHYEHYLDAGFPAGAPVPGEH